LNVGVPADIVETIPVKAKSLSTLMVLDQMYDRLVTEPASGLVPKPGLATSWTVSSDGLRYKFQLRDGVTFHNGRPLGAGDVVWSLNYVKNDPAGEFGNVSKVAAAGPKAVTVQLKRPQPDFLSALTGPGMGIMPRDFGGLSEKDFRAHPIGSGPFEFVNRVVGNEIRFQRNDAYWGEKAKVKDLDFKVFLDANAQSLALQGGEIDVASEVAVDALPTMQGTVKESAPLMVELLQFNSNTQILQNDDFRRALSLGIDREDIATNLFSGHAEPARSLLGKVVFPDGPPEASATGYDYDPERAKQLVRDSGYDGKPLNLIYGSSYADSVAIASALQAEWKKIGVNVSLKPLEFGEWLKAVTSPQPHGGYDLSVTTIGSGTISHQLEMMVWTEHFGSGWPTDDVAQGIAEFSKAKSPEEIQDALSDFEVRQSNSLRSVPITYTGYIWVLRDGVDGFAPQQSQYVRLNTVTVP